MANLLERVATLSAGSADGLDRETALALLFQLKELLARRRRGPHYVFCAYCAEGFDIANDARATPGDARRPPRHPDPVGAAETVAGAQEAAVALAESMTWRDLRLRGPEAFWVDFGCTVLWPLLFLARERGWDMDRVRLLTHPNLAAHTMTIVGADLDALERSSDVDRARRQWARIADTDARGRRASFGYAYRLVRYWQVAGPWTEQVAGDRGGEGQRGNRTIRVTTSVPPA